jgi:hypothetical protein
MGWRARCPAHDGKSRDSLSVTVTDDGRLLIYCFAGCATLEIVQAIGLELTDLMPDCLTHHAAPEQKRKWRQDAQHRDWCKVVQAVMVELYAVQIASHQLRDGHPLNDDDQARLDSAVRRIAEARRRLSD